MTCSSSRNSSAPVLITIRDRIQPAGAPVFANWQDHRDVRRKIRIGFTITSAEGLLKIGLTAEYEKAGTEGSRPLSPKELAGSRPLGCEDKRCQFT